MNKKIISIIMLILSVISLFAYKYRLDDGFRIKHNKILYFADSNPYYKSQREKWLFDSFLKEKAIPDYKNWDVILKIQVSNKYDLINPIRISFEDYLNNSFKASFHNSLIEKNLNLLKEKERESTGGLIPDIQLDNFAIPKPIQVVTGKAASKIRIDGSQKITISGKYQEKVNQHIDDNDYGRVKFDPKMEQELKLGLHGTIGDKIFVDINHHSNLDEQIFDPNNIGLRYEGYEDEIIKKIEAGNISLSLSGSRYLSVSGSSQGLFGVKTEMQFGDLSIITIASKEEGKRTTAKYDGNTQNDSTVIWSKDFSKLKHYYILNPYNLFITRQNQEDPAGWNGNAIELDEYGNWLMDSAAADFMPQEGTVQVYVDDNLATNNNIAIEGYEIGEDQLYHFDELIEGTDYLVNYSNGLITFNNRVATKVTIGITYTQQNGIVVGSNSGTLNVKIIKRQYQNNSDDTW
ncbi:MAG: hypothetical protein U9N34_02025, partial [Candidatus Cloacimonadota bacterium]|nr:hypothetical protein [Candidatus Cloacimonadota bacterium]